MQNEERRKTINLKNAGVNLVCRKFRPSSMVINVTVLDLPLNLVWNKSKGSVIVANCYHNHIYIYFFFFFVLFGLVYNSSFGRAPTNVH